MRSMMVLIALAIIGCGDESHSIPESPDGHKRFAIHCQSTDCAGWAIASCPGGFKTISFDANHMLIECTEESRHQ